ncbi:DUF421 domain-containing protein [Jeotgalibacillus sp. S-D1]|uniref:DUF421 domain-containing protein n=1 Tax=Jeotgalibacillus sp. S-D1 TaxID=2552189 RepID=UPI00105A3BBF|nr:DUF421 domain-containing protein [Jeotgalibacillus sp. S-D1]TDL33105.1 DUF421 domain-containing protein [Jeotgalibacillus sp. S-D1]
MFETANEIPLILGRVVTILPLLLLVTIFMGKRAIGELPIFDFLVILTLGSVVGAELANPEVHQLPTAAAIILIALLQRLVAKWKLSSRLFGRYITFEPTVVVQNGKLLNQNMKKIGYSIDNILQMLREKDVFDLLDVETAIIESSGSLSVLKKPQKSGITAEDLQIVKSSSLAIPVILEGTISEEVLEQFNLNEEWIDEQLRSQGISDRSYVFFASLNKDHQLHISLKNEENLIIPKIKH